MKGSIIMMFNTNYMMPASDKDFALNKEKCCEGLEKLNAAVRANDYKAIESAENALKDQVKELNAAIVSAWLAELKTMDKAAAVELYLENAGELGAFRVKEPSGDDVEYTIVSTRKYVSYKNLVKCLDCASSSAWDTLSAQMLDNIGKFLAKDKESGIDAKIINANCSEKKQNAFTKYTKTGLLEQLNIVVKSMLPADFAEVKMIKADLNFILAAMEEVKTGANAGIVLMDETRLTKTIVSAIRIRKNGLKYDLESKAKIHKSK